MGDVPHEREYDARHDDWQQLITNARAEAIKPAT
jgi:hypothetical protein